MLLLLYTAIIIGISIITSVYYTICNEQLSAEALA